MSKQIFKVPTEAIYECMAYVNIFDSPGGSESYRKLIKAENAQEAWEKFLRYLKNYPAPTKPQKGK